MSLDIDEKARYYNLRGLWLEIDHYQNIHEVQ